MIEPQSLSWIAVRRHVDAEIERHRTALESDLGPVETATLRGKIAALKKILALAEPKAPPVAEKGVTY